jgi:hypothetical protein
MAKQIVNIGTASNSRNGDPLRTAFTKINANFTELYASESQLTNGAYTVTLDASGVVTLPTSLNGLLRTDSGVVSVAVAGQDYIAPFSNPTLRGLVISSGLLSIDGNISSSAWTTNGVRLGSRGSSRVTDTTSTGTVANAYTNVLGGDTVAATNTVTFTNYSTAYIPAPTAGTNVTITNSYSLITGGNVLLGGTLTFPNNYTFTGQTLTDTSGTTNYSLKIANGTTGSVFAVGTGTDAYGVANDALDHTQTTYVPYNATASTISFNVPGKVGSLTINENGIVTVPNGLVIPTGTKASNATGTAGQISYDSTYMYICISTNTWRRVALGGTY